MALHRPPNAHPSFLQRDGLFTLRPLPLGLGPGTAGHEAIAQVTGPVVPADGRHRHQGLVLDILQLVAVVARVGRG